MSQAQDNALALTVVADAITAQTNSLQNSQLHYQGAAAHAAASAAWAATNANPRMVTYHGSQASSHAATAASLKSAGK